MIEINKPRRMYYSDEFSLEYCPECKGPLFKERCIVLLDAKSKQDEARFLTNKAGAHFCEQCPVVVLDSAQIEFAAAAGLTDDSPFVYDVLGIVDLDAIPKEKRKLELGTDDNPIPLVHFLPDSTGVTGYYSLNSPCPCGSGKKYKRCCGQTRSRRRLR